MIEDLRWRGAAYAAPPSVGEPFLVAQQVGGARSQKHTHSIARQVGVEETGIADRLARRDDRDLIAARQPTPRTLGKRRIAGVGGNLRHLAASVSSGVEQRHKIGRASWR